jgi:hypothetical protein
MTRRIASLLASACLGFASAAAFAQSPPLAVSPGAAPSTVPAGKEDAANMRLVGYEQLQGRNAYQPTIVKQGSRYIAYIGHHGGKGPNPLSGQEEFNGTSIVDVTDPAKPKYLAHLPGQEGRGEQGGAQMTRICTGLQLPHADKSKTYLYRAVGQLEHEIWDVTTPEKPTMLTKIGLGTITDTHKSWWECESGLGFLVSGGEGWHTRRMLKIWDLSDPAHPKFIRDFGLVGQEPTAPDNKEAHRYDLHGPIPVAERNRVYMGYGNYVNGVVQVLDREKLLHGNPAVANPLAPTPENLTYPVITTLYTPPNMGAHTALPILGVDVPDMLKGTDGKTRDFVAITGESIKENCLEGRQMLYMVDITTETRPFGISNFNVPNGNDYCNRGGRFGTHSINENQIPMYAKKLLFVTWFSAGVRAVDIRNPFAPAEIGHYIPALNERVRPRCTKIDGKDDCKTVIQTNNAEVDERGYIYIVDRVGAGLHILELTGAAKAIANP